VLTGTPTAAPGSSSTTINLTDNSGCPGSLGYTIVLNCPTVSVTNSSLPNGTVGTAYASATFAATTAGTGVPAQTYTWSVSPALPAGLTLTSGGVLSGTPTAATASTTYTFTASNQTSCTGSVGIAFSTICPTITVTPTTLTQGTVGSVYSKSLTASGGTSAYTWTTVSGTWPSGLSLSSAGVVSGTPSAATSGTTGSAVVVKATDANNCVSANTTINIKICPVLAIAPAAMPAAVVGTAYSQAVTASNGTGPYTYAVTSGALPAWATLSSGTISGTPSTTASATFTITATDANGCTGASSSYTIAPTCPTITVTPTSLGVGTVGSTYNQVTAFSASGGTAPYTFTASGLPTGMAFDAVNKKITGTPTFADVYTITITATDTYGCSKAQAVSFATCPGVNITPTTMPNGTLGFAYSQAMAANQPGFDIQQAFSSTAVSTLAIADAVLAGTNRTSNWTGSAATVNFTSSGGGSGHFTDTVFPAGAGDDFALKATGIITIPTAGSWTFATSSDDGVRVRIDGSNVIVDDALHSNADRFGTVTLTAGTHAIELVFFERSGGEAVELYAASGSYSSYNTNFKLIGASGGLAVVRSSPVYTWNITSGALPTGVALNTSSGLISGTPTGAAGVHSFILKATDTDGCFGTQALSITTACPTISVSPGSLAVGTVGSAYSQTITSTGSGSTTTFAVTSGTLPAGLSLSTGGVLSGTPTTANGAGTSITITATDTYGCAGSATYSLKICPVLTISPSSSFNGTVGTALNQTFTATNGTSPYTWAITSGTLPVGLSLNTSSGLLSGVPTAATTATAVTFQATDANGCSGTRPLNIGAVCPAVGITTGASLPQGIVGTAYSVSLTGTGGSSPYVFSTGSTLPAGLTLSSSGVLSGTPTAPTTGTGSLITVSIVDQYNCSGSKIFNVKVCPVITVSGSPPTGTTGSFYSTTFTASGSSATPITFAITAGTPPPGLSLNSSGDLSGTPTASGAPSVTITATDANGCTGSASFPIPIGCPVMTLSPTIAATGTVGTVYSQTITPTGGVAPYTFSILTGTLPAGLTLSSAGVISGTPTASTSGVNGTSVDIQALDSNNCTGTATVKIKICPVITISPAAFVNVGTVGTSYSQAFTQSGGATAVTWSIASGTLPSGLALNSVSGAVTGTPSVANGSGTSITMQVTDVNACVQTKTYNLKICPVISITPATLATGTVGTAYSQTFTASNGASPYTFTSGSLPAGLTLSSAGVLSGTPTASTGAGQSIAITAKDVNDCSTTANYTLKICPVITVSPSSIAAATVGTAYSQTFTQSGGATPITFSATGLPAWATLNASTGALTGTPNNTTSATFTITATDTNSCSGSQSYTLAPTCPTITVTPTTLSTPTVGSAYTQATAFSGTGLTGTYNWTATGVPTGMTFDATNKMLTGTPTTAGVFSLVVTATDSTYSACSGSVSISLRVCPVITMTSTLTAATVGTAYSRTITAAGGTASYTYAITSGSAPAGLSLSSGGVLSGTPTNNVTANFTITATDATGCTGTQAFTQTPACPTITVTPTTLAFATVGTSYNQTTAFSASGLTGTYNWTASGVPAGMAFSTATRKLTGTPTTAGLNTVVITATDTTYGTCAGSVTISFRVCPVLSFASLTTTGVVGTAYNGSAAASNGTAPYTYSKSAGTLPPGLSLDSSTAALTGTPTTSGVYSFTVSANDANVCPGSQAYTITITCPTITVSPNTLTFATVGSAYAQTPAFTATGLTGTYTWTASGLPSGLSLDTTNKKLIGTPSAGSQGAYTVTITATDSTYANCAGSVVISFRVCPVLTITPATLTAGVVGTAYSQTTAFSVSGGTAPYTFAVPTGIPTGMSWDGVALKLTGAPTAAASTNIVLNVTDANACPGTLTIPFTVACPTVSVAGSLPSTATQDTPYGTQTLTASGATSPYTWSVVSGALPTGLTLTRGVTATTATVSGTPTVVQSSTFTIRATGTYGCFKDTTYSIAVGCPVITITPATIGPFTQYTPISTVNFTATGGRSPYAWSATGLPAGLALSSTGSLTGNVTAAPGSYSVTVNLTDNSGCPGSAGYTLVVGCPTVTIGTASLPNGVVGTAITSTTFAASTSGTGVPAQTYTWSVSPALPAGLTLSSAGVLSGTPTVPTATTSYTFTATNQQSCPGTMVLSFSTSCPTIAVSPGSLAFATVGSAYSQTPAFSATGLTGAYVWTASGLPSGMSLDTTNKKLIGTPAAGSQGLYNVTITATDSTYPSCFGNVAISFRVCPVLSFASITNTATVGVAYSSTATASNGTAPYAYTVSAGSLPAGLALNPSNGLISGTPISAGVSSFTVAVTDGNNCPGSQAYTITTSCPTITVTPTTLANATVGTAYSQATAFSATTAGSTSLTWTASNVPAGMTFDTSTRMLTGTPTSAGSGNITVTATDPYLCTGSVIVPFTRVCPGLSISPASLPFGYAGASYSTTVTASGGNPPYTYVVSSGTLPSGLVLDSSTGAINGTPSVASSATVTIQATDVFACVVTRSYTFDIRTMGIGNLVFNDCNNNGIFDGTDTGLAGATVQLFSPGADNAIGGTGANADTQIGASIVTTSTGAYLFTNIPPGNYYIKVTPPATHALSSGTPVALDNQVNNDNNGVQSALGQPAYSPIINLADGAEPTNDGDSDNRTDLTVDFGFWTGFIVGNRVWADLNSDGLYQSGTESGVNGLTVALMTRGPNNIAYDGDDLSVATTTTVNGIYGFQVYTPGSYYFRVTPNGAYPVIGLNSVNLDNGVSNDNNGVNQPGLVGNPINSTVFTLAVCTEPGSTGSTNTDNSIDVAVRACPTIAVTPTTLPNAIVGASYNQPVAFTSTGGVGTMTYAATGVPAGMSFDTATLKLIGIPTTTGSGNITVTATDAYGCTGSVTVSLTRNCPTISVTPTSLSNAIVGVNYTQATPFSATTTGDTNFSWTASGVPVGMSFNPFTQQLNGVPFFAGSNNITVTATDPYGCTGSVVIRLTRVCPTIAVTPTTLATATVGVSYVQDVPFNATTTGDTDLTWTATGVPAGMTFNTSTLQLTGTPATGGIANVTVTATDPYGCAGSVVISFTRTCPSIVVTPASLPFATVDSLYAQSTPFSAMTTGDANVTWTASGLPSGMSFDTASNTLVGRPIVGSQGVYSVTITATDPYGCFGNVTFNLRVCPVLSITPITLPGANVGLSYIQTTAFAVGNGTAPYTIDVVGLPGGLSFDSATSKIIGTPASLGTSTQTIPLTVNVTDADGCPGTLRVDLTVLPAMRVGNLVWLDSNANGIKDSGESGVPGVTMQLWNAGANGVEENGMGDDIKIGADVITDSNGNYTFDNVPPGAGYYVLMPNPLPNRGVASANVVISDNQIDNDNNAQQPNGPGTWMRSPKFTLSVESEAIDTIDGDDFNGEMTIDFGVKASVCVGNLVFKDTDNNGIYDDTIDETVDGATLQLFPQGADPLASAPVQTTVTSGGGIYSFCVLPGSYFVFVPPSQFDTGGALYGTKPTVGPTDSVVLPLDDDVDQNALPTSKPVATGVRTGNFTLAIGTQPTNATGESGANATDDDAYDADVDLTVDLGFFPITGYGAPLAGRVRRDLTGSGVVTTASTPLPGVEVVLYADTNNNGTLDTNELSAVGTTTTDASGVFAFTGIDDGHYIVAQTVLPGATATFANNSTNAEQTSVTLNGNPVNDLTFLQAITPDTFTQWQQQHAGSANSNSDGDQYDDLMEYALGTSPDGSDAPHFWIEQNNGSVDAVLRRGTNGHLDVQYRIEASSDLNSWHTLALAPAVASNADGTDTVRYVDVAGTQRDGFIRLQVILDADHDGTAEATSHSPVFAYHQHEVLVGQQTFSMPLTKPALWAGKIASVSADTLTVAGAKVSQGQSLYIEVLDGEFEGQRFDVDATAGTEGTIKLNTTSRHSTQHTVPAALAGARIALRAHWTVNELFPTTTFVASNSATKSDRVLFFDAATQAYRVLWLCTTSSGPRWLLSGDSTMANAGSTIVGPSDAVMLNARTRTLNLTLLGEVRGTKFAQPLLKGSQLLSTATALSLSPAQAGMVTGFTAGDLTTADRLQVWLGDTTPTSAGYTTYFYQAGNAAGNFWSSTSGTDASSSPLLKAFRGVFIISTNGGTQWVR
jgi:protocatechuate 3,4-dioxygenase beta subunit